MISIPTSIKTACIVLLLSSCSAFQRPQPGPGEALLLGSKLPCYGYVLIESKESTSSRAIVRSGPQVISIAAESEPDFSEASILDSRYECSLRSKHVVKFEAEGGKSYRLHLDEIGVKHFRISVWEGLDRFADKTKLIPSESIQISIVKNCGFTQVCENWWPSH